MTTSGEINKKAVSAVKWAAVGTVTKFAVQLAAQVVLARLLGPDSYGLFAMGLVVLTLSNFLADFGFSWSLVQNVDLAEEDIRFAITWQFLSGALSTLALFLLAPWIADYFNEPRLEPIVRWLSLCCVITAITTPGSNLLRRNLDFRWLNIIQISSYIFGYLILGIPLAYAGAGVWTLVSAWLGQTLFAFVATLVRSPHSMRPLFWYHGAGKSTNMGSTVFVTNLVNWMLNNLDRVFLGRFLNAHAVGIYTVGYNLANTPNSLFLTALQPAFLATGAKLQGDPARLRDAFLAIVATIWIVIAPMFVLLALVSNDFVAVLYGAKWLGSGTVLAILAISMPAYITWGMSTPILWNTAGKHLESMLQVPVLIIAAILFMKYSSYGIVTVATITAGVMMARCLVIATAACLRIGVTCRDLLPSATRSVLIMSVTAAGTLAGLELGHRLSAGSLLPFLLGSAAGACCAMLVALAAPNLLGRRVVSVISRFCPPIPQRLNRYLHDKCMIG